MTVTAKFYDRQTPFNGVPVSIINEEFQRLWKDSPVVLIYRDGKFSGVAEPWAGTLEEAAEKYRACFEEQEAQQAQALKNPDPQERIAAALEFQNLMSL